MEQRQDYSCFEEFVEQYDANHCTLRIKYGFKGKGGIAGTGGPGTNGRGARMTLRNKTAETRRYICKEAEREAETVRVQGAETGKEQAVLIQVHTVRGDGDEGEVRMTQREDINREKG